jgi:hypothetical protein
MVPRQLAVRTCTHFALWSTVRRVLRHRRCHRRRQSTTPKSKTNDPSTRNQLPYPLSIVVASRGNPAARTLRLAGGRNPTALAEPVRDLTREQPMQTPPDQVRGRLWRSRRTSGTARVDPDYRKSKQKLDSGPPRPHCGRTRNPTFPPIPSKHKLDSGSRPLRVLVRNDDVGGGALSTRPAANGQM